MAVAYISSLSSTPERRFIHNLSVYFAPVQTPLPPVASFLTRHYKARTR